MLWLRVWSAAGRQPMQVASHPLSEPGRAIAYVVVCYDTVRCAGAELPASHLGLAPRAIE